MINKAVPQWNGFLFSRLPEKVLIIEKRPAWRWRK
jgi:hypothetical protein